MGWTWTVDVLCGCAADFGGGCEGGKLSKSPLLALDYFHVHNVHTYGVPWLGTFKYGARTGYDKYTCCAYSVQYCLLLLLLLLLLRSAAAVTTVRPQLRSIHITDSWLHLIEQFFLYVGQGHRQRPFDVVCCLSKI